MNVTFGGFAAGAVMLSACSASAADFSAQPVPASALSPVPVASWSGFYAGVNAGYLFDAGQSSRIAGEGGLQINIADGIRPGRGRLQSNGFTGGGQVGYNYQLGSGNGLVVGVEADAAYAGASSSAAYVSDRLSTFSDRTSFVGTVRGRLGYAFGAVLAYGTFGFAYGDTQSTSVFYDPLGRRSYIGSADRLRTGVAYGGGVEVAVSDTSFLNVFRANGITVKAEFIRYDLGRFGLRLANLGGAAGYDQSIRANGNIARVGVNYKFGATPSAPVVARY